MDGMCSVAQLVERLLVKPKIPGLNLQDFRFWSFLFWALRFTLFNPSQLFFDEKIFFHWTLHSNVVVDSDEHTPASFQSTFYSRIQTWNVRVILSTYFLLNDKKGFQMAKNGNVNMGIIRLV